MKNTIVTISREYGSGGRIIAQQLSERLNIPLYDQQIIAMTAGKSGLAEEFVARSEQQGTSFLYTIATNWDGPSVAEQMYLAEFDVIRDLAAKGTCILLGRCADYILQDNPDCLKVFLHAPLEIRTARAEQEYGHREKDIRRYVQKRDKGRANYYQHFTANTWGKAQHYDLCINTAIGLEKTVDILAAAYLGNASEN